MKYPTPKNKKSLAEFNTFTRKKKTYKDNSKEMIEKYYYKQKCKKYTTVNSNFQNTVRHNIHLSNQDL